MRVSVSISNQWVPGRRSAFLGARTQPGAPSATCVRVCACVCKEKSETLTACSRLSPSLQLANSVSLPLQTLDLNLLRIQCRRKQRQQQQAASKSAASLPQLQDVPSCLLDRLHGHNCPALHPRYGKTLFLQGLGRGMWKAERRGGPGLHAHCARTHTCRQAASRSAAGNRQVLPKKRGSNSHPCPPWQGWPPGVSSEPHAPEQFWYLRWGRPESVPSSNLWCK